MKQPNLITFAALATLALAACESVDSTNPAAERGIEERPMRDAQVTLPPQWTPTHVILPSLSPAPATPTPTPTPDPFSALESGAPWLLYCDEDEQAALMALGAPGRFHMGLPCFAPQTISASQGIAIDRTWIIQFPGGSIGRSACCEVVGWSADGNRVLSFNVAIGDETQLIVYDAALDRTRYVASRYSYDTPLGLSPDGRWLLVFERESGYERGGSRTPPAEVIAMSYDGQEIKGLFAEYDAGVVTHAIAGWASESAALIARSESPCNLEPRNLELLYADLDAGTARHIFDLYSEFAFDPASGTALLEELPRGECVDGPQYGRLVRLSAADRWAAHPVALPGSEFSKWDIGRIEWHPELQLFSVLARQGRDGAPLQLITLDTEGTVEMAFSLGEAQVTHIARIFPSPDGDWILIGASPPHGTVLYDDAGEPVRSLEMPGGELSYGLQHVVWAPDSSAFYISAPETPGIFRAAAEDGWEPTQVEAETDYGTRLTLVQPPDRPYRPICNDYRTTRLHVGDRVVVSTDPPLNSRMRFRPGLDRPVVGVVHPGEQARIVDGPLCADGYVWWELESEPFEVRGWAAQGDELGAWLLPAD